MNTNENIQHIPLEKLHVSVLNTRQPKPGNPAVKELAKSLAENGQTTPLIVRPSPDKRGHFEIGAGARRRVAGGVAKLPTLDCIVREMDDREFEELILIENLQREDPDPKAEAEHLARLVGRDEDPDIAALAARCGKPEKWVVRRLQLLKVIPAIRKEWRGGALGGASVTMMEFVGSLPVDLQKGLYQDSHFKECRTRKDAKSLVDVRYGCRLDTAPFPLDDERFFGECGVAGCASDSRAQPLLFDFEKPECGRCLNRECFQSRLAKWRAHVLAKVERGEDGLIYVTRTCTPRFSLPDGTGIEPLWLWELHGKYGLEVGRKADEGSRRAVDVTDPDKPRSVYLVPIKRAGAETGEPDKNVPADKEEEKRERLQARRWSLALTALTDRLGETGLAAVNGDVFELAAVFGLPYKRDYRDGSWKQYDKGKRGEMEQALWEGLIEVFADRLRCHKVGDTIDALPEMRRVAKLIGFDLDAAKLGADEQLPPPKVWGSGIDPHTLKPVKPKTEAA